MWFPYFSLKGKLKGNLIINIDNEISSAVGLTNEVVESLFRTASLFVKILNT
ncbi:hypothetical protein V8245_12560 [Flavobacterium columnare]|uniref:hypothetical protein n=1 Tax=Flavobacterium columnare TaxID=996 RepID=UPI0013F667EE|nr:hypothetical protein [Flavobacterium columnare]